MGRPPRTSVFPSTTAAALTTVHSGLTPQEHGLPEWWVYFDELDTIAATLPFTPLGMPGQDRLLEAGVKPAILFDGKTVYQALAKAQVPSFTFIRDTYAQSAYSRRVHKGSRTIRFINASDLLVNLRQTISQVSGPAYFYVVTADHGHIAVAPQEALYLNRYPSLVRSLRRSAAGKTILPWGSPRDVFLRVEDEALPAVAAWLRKRLQDKALVMTAQEALEQGFFGRGTPHKRLKRRIGNLLILPHRQHLVWYEHVKGKKFGLRGTHGGLSADEMLIPLAVANLAALQ